MDAIFLKAHAERCRSLADNADEFTRRRLLDLAASYDKRIMRASSNALSGGVARRSPGIGEPKM
jgi:hypothetical protein